MSVVQQPSATGEYIIFRQRRGVELALTLAACTFGLVGWVVSYLNLRGSLPPELIPGTIIWFALALGAHAIVRWRIPYADPVILPVVFLLNGLGLAMIARLDLAKNAHAATNQIIWTGLGIALFAAVVFWLRDHRRLQRFPYLLFLGGLLMLILPLVPPGSGSGWARSASSRRRWPRSSWRWLSPLISTRNATCWPSLGGASSAWSSPGPVTSGPSR